jgi:hypothetical protein
MEEHEPWLAESKGQMRGGIRISSICALTGADQPQI